MATVYRGTDLRLGRTVALKVLGGVLANDPDFVERFTQEARATAALTHPNVVAVHELHPSTTKFQRQFLLRLFSFSVYF